MNFEQNLKVFLKKRNISCYKLLFYDIILWIIFIAITIYLHFDLFKLTINSLFDFFPFKIKDKI